MFDDSLQAAGHGGLSRMPRSGEAGGPAEPCVTCIRIELGETVCPDGEQCTPLVYNTTNKLLH